MTFLVFYCPFREKEIFLVTKVYFLMVLGEKIYLYLRLIRICNPNLFYLGFVIPS